jgi:hypothetical protein
MATLSQVELHKALYELITEQVLPLPMTQKSQSTMLKMNLVYP